MKTYTTIEMFNYFQEHFVDATHEALKQDKKDFKLDWGDVDNPKYLLKSERREYKKDKNNIEYLERAYKDAQFWLEDQKDAQVRTDVKLSSENKITASKHKDDIVSTLISAGLTEKQADNIVYNFVELIKSTLVQTNG